MSWQKDIKEVELYVRKNRYCSTSERRSAFRHPSAHVFWSVSQLEIDNGDELTSDFLYEEVHPKQYAHKQAFAKPRGPAGTKGGRRITRPPAGKEEED